MVTSLTNRFQLNSKIEAVHGFASFLDPRSKQLSFINNEKKSLITVAISNIIGNIEIVKTEENVNSVTSSALDFIFHNLQVPNNGNSELQTYLQDIEINYNLCSLERWKTREQKYPRLAKTAKKYSCIPATSASSGKVYSTAGNIVNPKRTSLLPENLLIFLYIIYHSLQLDKSILNTTLNSTLNRVRTAPKTKLASSSVNSRQTNNVNC